ncbi:MAG: MBL fold metallo-hydrolase [Patescibacteria group bacterium]
MDTFFKQKGRAVLVLIALIIVTVVTQSAISGTSVASNEKLAVWIFDVGQGDAIFIDAPEAQILIDGGPSSDILEKLSQIMPFWDRSIDVVINTHPHADHVTGLNYVLERYEVGEVWVSGQEYGTDVFAEFNRLADERLVAAGEEIDLGQSATLKIIWPEHHLDGVYLDDTNDGSIVTLLEYGETSVLLTGDIGVAQERELLDDLDHIDVLKVGHQGSLTSSSNEFLRDITPDYAIICVGENDYGHPDPIVLDRFDREGASILRTDLDGDVRITSDGGEPEVAVFDL